MTTAALITLVLTGFATGLLVQFLTVQHRFEPDHVPLAYVGTGVIGAAGALCYIPLIMLLDYGRGASGSEILPTLTLRSFVIAGLLAAANALLLAKTLELGDRRIRFGMLVAVSAAWVFIGLGVLLGRPA